MIKQILFDCGGVLVHLHFRELVKELSGSDEMAEAFWNKLFRDPESPWRRYDQGLLNTEEVEEALKKEMPEDYHPVLAQFMKLWPEWLPPIEGMEELLAELKRKGYGLYLLSNFSHRYDAFAAGVPALALIDQEVVSYRAKLIKPDPAIYEYAAEQLGIQPEETLFVDDTVVNIEVAKKVGYHGFVFTDPAGFKTYLREQGIL